MSDNVTQIVDLSIIPRDECIEFRDSSFFRKHAALPSIAQVREQAERQGPLSRHHPVYFPDMGLIVKYGPLESIAEAQTMWMIGHYLKDKVPVPELYGWKHDDQDFFIYMELVKGVTLKDCWDSLSDADRESICLELRAAIRALRTLRQDPSDPFVGHVARQPILDTFVDGRVAGPFPSVHALHEYIAFWPSPSDPYPDGDPDRWRLPDDAPIVFTHGDLDKSNILVSTPTDDGQRPRLLSIIDWYQSGWYPDYWEYCKAARLVREDDEWATRYIPMFLDVYEDIGYWDYYTGRYGI
ncbi:kinase-like protein [Gloeophyllum trabeum ATCC 11539]|uniref:Kinase-like protein n=1 Tax=Gloeophyllum trabeum (strain ATCC 11539 / FP-39264 / Madison 617) TaxID=670483 RepID=S7RLF8_GLOTA|nr:kinase-like protein [Gloeophyllum trabeum ATCC 11539]EPQ53484.1 kinase-like protein [Gloeophyllum trabeum ATCC 11539]